MAADGKRFDRGNPRLLDGRPAELIRRRVVSEGKSAIDLVHPAQDILSALIVKVNLC